jgi:colanic acid/amylovoran biosynthesis glycosyltransferase
MIQNRDLIKVFMDQLFKSGASKKAVQHKKSSDSNSKKISRFFTDNNDHKSAMPKKIQNTLLHIGVIANMKAGLEHFVYRELLFFTAQGFSISLFPTRYNEGLYNTRDKWRLYRWSVWRVILWQPYFFFRKPIKYLRLLSEAIKFNATIDFVLAWYFSPKMADVNVIYATFGDHKLFIGYFSKRILNKPLAVTIHAYELYANPNPNFFVHALAACNQIITVTEHNREILQNQYQIDPSQVQVVRYSVDLQEYRSEKKFIVLIVSFFTQRKGHDVLLKAIKQLGREDIEVWVVGDTAGRQNTVDVKAMATQLGLASQVAFFGALSGNALKAIYRACDVFCLPCRKDSGGASEGFPNVLIEAMAFSKPVITSRHVEIPRIIPEILVDENDVQALAKAIEQVYQSATLRHRLSEQNRKIAETVFSPANTSRTAALLRNLAKSSEG